MPKIVCAHNKQEIDERLVPTVFALSGIIAEKLNQYKGLPVFNALNSIKELVDYIEDKVPMYSQYPKNVAESVGHHVKKCS